MLFNPLPSILRLGVALIGLALLAAYGWSLSAQDVPMDLLARQQPPRWHTGSVPIRWGGISGCGPFRAPSPVWS